MHDDGLLEQKAWAAGIASGYHDVDGRYYPAKPGVLAALLARLADEEHAEGDFDAVEVAAAGSVGTLVLALVDAPQAVWLADEAGGGRMWLGKCFQTASRLRCRLWPRAIMK